MNDIRCNPSSLLLPLIVGVFVLKFLLINCYYSTDFEVHRNWLAITYNLPLAHWYTESTSQWTLDYPPLFAWFEFVLAQFAAIIWPTASSQMLTISAQPYIDKFTLYFQRISVIVADVIYVFAVYRLVDAVERNHQLPPHRSNWRRCMLTALLIANTGLVLVDSVHFQYNSLLSAILLVAIANAIDGRLLLAALWYSLLLNFKHIYLYYAPAFVCYYLVHYFNRSYLNFNALYRAVQLAIVIALPFAVAFGPFIWYSQLTQVLQRMFPFQRGLTHAYWAPNIWSLYNCIDLILYHGIKRMVSTNTLQPPTYTSGLVQSYSHSVLPSIDPSTTALLTIASMIPFLIIAYNRKKQRPVRFVELLIGCAFSTYLFGWHVHEKAVILITIPYTILVVDDRRYISSFVLLITTAHYSLFPLFFTQFEISIKYLSTLIYSMFAIIGLSNRYGLIDMKTSQLSPLKYIYIIGLVCVEIYKCVVHPFIFINDTYPFIPLLVTSVYCSIGMIMIWVEFCWLTFIKDYCQFIYQWMWSREQKLLKSKLRLHIDNDKWNKNNVKYVGGVDISTSLNDDGIACACFVILSYPELKIVHQETEIVCIDEPYIAGYLAFREFRPLIKLIKNVKQSHPDIFPQVIFVDGNGILHPRGFGLACHIGVLTDVVCIGVAKNLHLIDGIVEDSNKQSKELHNVGDQFVIQSTNGQILGAAVRVTSNSNNAIFISIGHCIDLQTSIQLTINCCQHRIPQPIRMADQISRTEIRNIIDN